VKRANFIILLFFLVSQFLFQQNLGAVTVRKDTLAEKHYQKTFSLLEKMLHNKVYDLETAVYYVENAWHQDTLSYEAFHRNVSFLTSLVDCLWKK
jgi:hypothetical protein